MAQRVTVEMVDDLDGVASETVSTVSFVLDGVEYEIDLSEENADKLREAVSEFVAAARRTGGRAKRGSGQKRSTSANLPREQNQAIREWARANGWDMADRGRIPASVIEAYELAQADAAAETKPSAKAKKAKSKELAFSG